MQHLHDSADTQAAGQEDAAKAQQLTCYCGKAQLPCKRTESIPAGKADVGKKLVAFRFHGEQSPQHDGLQQEYGSQGSQTYRQSLHSLRSQLRIGGGGTQLIGGHGIIAQIIKRLYHPLGIGIVGDGQAHLIGNNVRGIAVEIFRAHQNILQQGGIVGQLGGEEDVDVLLRILPIHSAQRLAVSVEIQKSCGADVFRIAKRPHAVFIQFFRGCIGLAGLGEKPAAIGTLNIPERLNRGDLAVIGGIHGKAMVILAEQEVVDHPADVIMEIQPGTNPRSSYHGNIQGNVFVVTPVDTIGNVNGEGSAQRDICIGRNDLIEVLRQPSLGQECHILRQSRYGLQEGVCLIHGNALPVYKTGVEFRAHIFQGVVLFVVLALPVAAVDVCGVAVALQPQYLLHAKQGIVICLRHGGIVPPDSHDAPVIAVGEGAVIIDPGEIIIQIYNEGSQEREYGKGRQQQEQKQHCGKYRPGTKLHRGHISAQIGDRCLAVPGFPVHNGSLLQGHIGDDLSVLDADVAGCMAFGFLEFVGDKYNQTI